MIFPNVCVLPSPRRVDIPGMWRKLFSRLSVLSLLLCLATVCWWVRTSSKVDELTYQREDVELLRFSGADGKMVVTHALYDPGRPRLGSGKIFWESAPQKPDAASAALGFGYRSQPGGKGGRDSTLVLPMWMLVALFAVSPLCWLGGRARRKKKVKKIEGKEQK